MRLVTDHQIRGMVVVIVRVVVVVVVIVDVIEGQTTAGPIENHNLIRCYEKNKIPVHNNAMILVHRRCSRKDQ